MTAETVITLVGPAAVELARSLHGHMDILANDAADVFVDTPLDDESRHRLNMGAADVFIQPAATRRKKVLLADMESTLIENELVDDLADRRGVGAAIKAITLQGMQGDMSFNQSLIQRIALLQGTPESELQAVLAGWRASPGCQQMIAMLKAADIPVWLVSSGFSCFTQPIGAALGCIVTPGNELLIENGVLTGHVAAPIKNKETKRAVVDAVCLELGITPSDVAAVGDGANDLPMLQAVGAGFGHKAKPAVAAACAFNIRHSDLRAIAFSFGLKA